MAVPSLFTIFLVVFFDLVGFGIVIPILPYYAQHFGASAWELGWLMTSYSLMQLLFAPVWGRISDRVGRKPVLLVSILGSCLSMTFLGFAHSLQWLFIGRIFAGICGANISTAYAYIADVTTEENRARGMGIIGAGFGLGFIFGPAIGGLLATYGYDIPMFFGAGLAFLNLLFIGFKLKEPRLRPEVRATHSRRYDWESVRITFENPKTRFAVALFGLVTFAVTQMEVSFALFLNARYGFGAREAGGLLAVSGIVMALVQGGMIGRLSKKWGEVTLIMGGAALCSLSLVLFAHTIHLSWVIFSLITLALGHGVLHPSLSSLASKGAEAKTRGLTMGVFQSSGSLARVLGPPCAGWLYDHFTQGAPFYCGALILGFCCLFSAGTLRGFTILKATGYNDKVL